MHLLGKKKSYIDSPSISVDSQTDYNLFIKINVSKGADLLSIPGAEASHESKLKCNPFVAVKLNDKTMSTSRIKNSLSPTWDTTLQLPLVEGDLSNTVQFVVWDKHRRSKDYLGELRLNINDIFGNDKVTQFNRKTDFKWYKLYSSKYHNSFVTGSLLLSFELVAVEAKHKKTKTGRVKKSIRQYSSNSISSKDGDKVDHSFKNPNPSKSPPALIVPNVSKLSLVENGASNQHPNQHSAKPAEELLSPEYHSLLNQWLSTLSVTKTHSPDDQGFYTDDEGVDTESEDDDIIPQSISIKPSKFLNSPSHFLSPDSATSLLKPSFFSYDTDSSAVSYTGATGNDYSSNVDTDAVLTSSSNIKNKRFRRKSQKNTGESTHYELANNRDVLGVIFLEILSCSDLPPMRNATRTGFDMDPFVVLSFGRRTFRTSWKRHTLNPIFNERLAFEVLPSESAFDVQLSVLDKDHFSFHDKVAYISLPISDLNYNDSISEVVSGSSSPIGGSVSDPNGPPKNTSISIVENHNFVTSIRKKKFKKKVVTSHVDASKFKTLELSLNLNKIKYSEKYNPKIKIRTRFEPYPVLRKQFWRLILEKYDVNENGEFDFIELLVFLETLGSNLSDETITSFFKDYNKEPWTGDKLTIDQIVDSFEAYIVKNSSSDDTHIIKIERCPVCGKERLSRKQDVDIITHVAICASKDWSIANKLLSPSYVTSQFATKRWYSKFLIKLTYGKYALGGNNANILVQDRTTGIIMEEKMSIYVRLGIRLLYKGLDKADSGRVRKLLKKLSVKQGQKFDSPSSRNDIASFVKYHNLNLIECLLPNISEYKTFNDFFYRKLKPDARTIEAKNDSLIMTSPADCRATVFATISSATELWIKGRNFTVPKLLNGMYQSEYNKFENCSIGIFRLAPQDYHRFHSPVTGTIKSITHVDGEYYTVNPMAIRSELDVFGENVKTITIIDTVEFGIVFFIAVGAMMVGSIVMTVKENDDVIKGEELGYFKFGGSTVIVLLQSELFKFDEDLLKNSSAKVETLIRVGQSVGHSLKVAEFKRSHVNFNNQSDDYKLNLMRIITGGTGAGNSWERDNLSFNENALISDEEDDSESDISSDDLDEEYEEDD